MKNSEFNRIMHDLSWNGARGRPKGFSNKKAEELDSATKNDLTKRIIKNKQVLPVSLITPEMKDFIEVSQYTLEAEDAFYGKVLKRA